MAENLDILTKSSNDYLTYANAVIKARAIPSVEDNMKPVHRRILWTFHKLKVTPDKKTVKSARVVGECMGKYHPHGDASIYDAMIRLGQWWKMRYPLVYVQGNAGTILGDGPAASRYTECKLTEVGALMLEDINKNCVKMRPNYDDTETEPAYLPSKFPNILCNGNAGIAVGLSSGLLPHNYTEVAGAISYYLDNQNCQTKDLMNFIKGPDFPTGGEIINGEELLAAYESGAGVVRVRARYVVNKKTNGKTEIKFLDLPYGVELEDGVLNPLKKLVVEEGFDEIEDYTWASVNGMPQLSIVLEKGADVQAVLNVIFAKTRLQVSVKLNNMVIVNKEPKLLSLKDMIAAYVNHRSMIITAIARNDLENANHRMTVVIGLQKCLSDIDTLINLIRNADNRASAKIAIMKQFVLNDEQAEAILEMKLARLSKLDITDLEDERKNLEKKIENYRDIINNYTTRAKIIKDDLASMKKLCGDERKTIVSVNADALPLEEQDYKWFNVVSNKAVPEAPTQETVTYLWARSSQEIVSYDAEGNIGPVTGSNNNIGAFVIDNNKKFVVSVTKNGQVKLSSIGEYNFSKRTKVMKIKDGDELIYAGLVNRDEYILIINSNKALKLPVSELTSAGKLTVGVKSGLVDVVRASAVNDADILFIGTSDKKGHLINAKDFGVDSKGNKGQTITENTQYLIKVTDRDIVLKFKTGKPQILAKEKLAIKGKTAIGAAVATKIVTEIC